MPSKFGSQLYMQQQYLKMTIWVYLAVQAIFPEVKFCKLTLLVHSLRQNPGCSVLSE